MPFYYSGAKLRKILMPMGGLGAGSIGLSGEGELREWAIFNRPGANALLKNSYFGIWFQKGNQKPAYRVLQKRTVDYPYVRLGNVHLYQVEDIRFYGQYPWARLEYIDKAFSAVKVILDCFSPCIPLNVKDSALPAVVFKFTVINRSRQPLKTTLLGSLLNAVGYDGQEEIYWALAAGLGGNINRFVKTKDFSAIHCCNKTIPNDAPCHGSMSLATTGKQISFRASCAYPPDSYFLQFLKTGRLENEEDKTPSGNSFTTYGMLAAHQTIAPGTSKEFIFFIAWHFPNRTPYWQSNKDERIGNMFNNWFHDSLDATRYAAKNLKRLHRETENFRDTLFSSTLPEAILQAASGQIVIPRSPTCFWTEDGTFAGFEGSRSHDGSCPLNCTHVWNYEQTLAFLFPELERNMRKTDLQVLTEKDGFMHHRLLLPATRKQTHGLALDGQLGTVLKTYREYLLGGDKAFLSKSWPVLKSLMNYVCNHYDSQKTGIIDDVAQPNTYDLAFWGVNPFIGSLYLAAMRAMEEMAKIIGQDKDRRAYQELFESGRRLLDRACFNGEYFIQRLPKKNNGRLQFGNGCLTDQLIGQWWANILGLGHILPKIRVESALRAIYKYNFRSMKGFCHTQRVFAEGDEWGVVVCSWPRGGMPAEPMHYCHEVWTGVEYSLAALLIQEGLVKEGLNIVQAVRARHNGSNRNPFNDCEAGSYYTRAMSSWSLVTALSGFGCNLAEKSLAFSPRINENNFQCFFSAGSGWGVYRQKKEHSRLTFTLDIRCGSLSLKKLYLPLPKGLPAIKARMGKKILTCEKQNGAVVFSDLCRLKAPIKLELICSSAN